MNWKVIEDNPLYRSDYIQHQSFKVFRTIRKQKHKILPNSVYQVCTVQSDGTTLYKETYYKEQQALEAVGLITQRNLFNETT